MNKVVFFDTETTGLPVWDKPSDSEEPRNNGLVPLIVLLCDY